MSTPKHASIFSRLSSSSASVRSSSSTEPSIPKSCRDAIRARYAKDGKGHDFNLTYPYGTNIIASGASSTHSSEVPQGCRDFKLRYAKDGKGHDFAPTYTYSPSPADDSSVSLAASDAMPAGCRDYNKNMRYAWHQGRQGS
ncbi:uncharacterized protein Z519_11164 [Cladophialophora bantiana CBS 173.52]|uniref:Uncharacterized protein n=1 Tax=Cladophialophora bantiana (strain ATCC 10958 / CBS 173.52 / CDC B-1940 / NIH 8579) TaxID=1442370 RepID=A0A0D2HU81_CLAB1|nr:uncharacterized protein Z519_11164 [Cladophialophora bantiana CBS 173.52]KIW88054.1 hypothetical protein Z519_11164 [Cladophialophora bantiana CBS 173.52]